MSHPKRELEMAILGLELAKDMEITIKRYEAECIANVEHASGILKDYGRKLRRVQSDLVDSHKKVERMVKVVQELENKYIPIDLCDDDDVSIKVRRNDTATKEFKRKAENDIGNVEVKQLAQNNTNKLVITGVDWMVDGIYNKMDRLYDNCPIWRKNFSHDDWGEASSVIYREIAYGVLCTWIIALMPRECNPDDKTFHIKRFFAETCTLDDFPPKEWTLYRTVDGIVRNDDKLPVLFKYQG